MGTLRGDNGGDRPPDGGGLPDLPPEWGIIVIPDDAAELDREATIVRKEIRRSARRNRWRRRVGLPTRTLRSNDDDAPALGLPLLIMSIAIIATLTSLFAIAWPSRAGQSAPSSQSATPVAQATIPTVPELTLTDAKGQPLQLRANLPAVILLVDGCPCADLIAATARAVDARVTVLAVAQTDTPKLPGELPIGRAVRAARDEAGTLRATYGGPSPGPGVTALLVKGSGEVIIAISNVRNVEKLRGYLDDLA